jgi:hypothetical protein
MGWNEPKIKRLTDAGADLLVADFREADSLLAMFTEGVLPEGV